MADIDSVRAFALSLPGAGEEPHFDLTSFRVVGKIFATAPPGGSYLHVFVGDDEVAACVAEDPGAFEPLLWGKRVRGLRVRLAAAQQDRATELLEESWRRKAPRSLVTELEARSESAERLSYPADPLG